MNNQDLIERLKALPPTASVCHLFDGFADATVDVVYMAKNGTIVLASFNEGIDADCYRPVDAPLFTPEVPFWRTPSDPKEPT